MGRARVPDEWSANRKLAQLLAATFSTGGEIRHITHNLGSECKRLVSTATNFQA